MIRNQKGFTLIESLVVFSIFLLIASITAFTIKPQYHFTEDEVFFSQLKADLLFAQQYAISHQQEVTVNINPEIHRYYITGRFDLGHIISRDYSINIKISPGSLPLYFKFTASGSVEKFGSLRIQTEDKVYRLTFLIGKGRFYVVEE